MCLPDTSLCEAVSDQAKGTELDRNDPVGAGDVPAKRDTGGALPPQSFGPDLWMGVSGLRHLIARNFLMMSVIVLVVMAAAAAVVFNLDERYSARATIVLEVSETRINLPDALLESIDVSRTQVETEVDVMRSRDFAAAVAERLDLFRDPDFNPSREGVDPSEPVTSEDREAVIGAVLGSFVISRSGESLALDIITTGDDPVRTAEIANAIAAEYIDQSLATKRESVETSIAFLQDRVRELGDALVQSESDLAAFIRSNNLEDEEYAGQLRTQMERQASILSLTRQTSTDEAEIQALEAELAALEEQLQNRTRAELGLLNRERALEIERDRYQVFVDRLNQLASQMDILQPGARQISIAEVPREPSWPNTNSALALSLVGAISLAFFAALIREGTDRRIWSDSSVARATGLQNLSQIPHLKRRELRKAGGLSNYLAENPRSPFAEAVRTLFSYCESGRGRDECRILMISSGLPKEGKSTLALALARSAAADGLRVLLIDFDVHRQGVSELLALEDNRYTMEELWKNSFLLRAEIKRNAEACGLDALSFSRNSPVPRQALSEGDFGKAWQALKLRYDVIILDTAPVLIVNDAARLAPIADDAILVSRWGRTTEESLRDAAGQLKRNGVPIIGTVISDVDVPKQVRYGYGGHASYYAYGSSYYR